MRKILMYDATVAAMLTAIIAEKTPDAMRSVIKKYPIEADAFELRLDCLQALDITALTHLRQPIAQPIICTLRSVAQSGYYQGNTQQRAADLQKLATLAPEYLDLEAPTDHALMERIHQQHPQIRIVYSYHNHQTTPEDLDAILSSMHHPAVAVYKIITYAHSTLDTLRILHFVQKHRANHCLVAHAMGPIGLPSRILGPVVGNAFHYARTPSSEKIPSHIPDLHTLRHTYRIKTHNADTKIFALLGDPVAHSMGPSFHNAQFHRTKTNAVYIALRLTHTELPAFFKALQCSSLPFYGFSVTTPLKEAIAVGAVNTLRRHKQGYETTNTDGLGALHALCTHIPTLHPCHLLILGAGGTAKAIAHAAHQYPLAAITLVNRTFSKAQSIAHTIKGTAYDIPTFQKHAHKNTEKKFDIIINTLPNNKENDALVHALIQPHITDRTYFMNVDYSHKNSTLTDTLQALGAHNIPAQEMFTQQARLQQAYWGTTEQLDIPMNHRTHGADNHR